MSMALTEREIAVRRQRAETEMDHYSILPLSEFLYRVSRVDQETGELFVYEVDVYAGSTCTCPDYIFRGQEAHFCKHICWVHLKLAAFERMMADIDDDPKHDLPAWNQFL